MDSSRRGPKPIRRTRTIYSCLPCRNRKIRCDKAQPICGNCSRANEVCEYVLQPRKDHSAGPEQSSPVPSIGKTSQSATQTKSSSEEGFLSGHSEPHRQYSTNSSASTSSATPELRSREEVVENLPGSLIQDTAHGQFITQDFGSHSYVGASHWAYAVRSVEALGDLLGDAYRSVPPRAGRLSRRAGNPGQPIDYCFQTVGSTGHGSAHTESLQNALFAELPSREQCNFLYRNFVVRMHSFSPIVYLPQLLQWYDDFWQWLAASGRDKNTLQNSMLLPVICAILHAGITCASQHTIEATFPDRDYRKLKRTFNEQATSFLNHQQFFYRPHLPGLIAFLVLLMSDHRLLPDRVSFSIVVQSCITLGLHREPTKSSFSIQETETRRRVWHHVVWLDAVLATASGMPPLVPSDAYWDTQSTSELRDDLIGTTDGIAYLSMLDGGAAKETCGDPLSDISTSRIHLGALVGQTKPVVSKFLRKIGAILFGAHPIGPNGLKACTELLLPLEAELQDRISRIPDPSKHSRDAFENYRCRLPNMKESFWQWYGIFPRDEANATTIIETRFAWAAFHKLARIWLGMILHRYACLIYKSVLRSHNPGAWNAVRLRAVSHGHSFLERWLTVATSKLYSPFYWSWPSLHPPHDVMAMLLVDLCQSPNAGEARKSRLLIDSLFICTTVEGQIAASQADKKDELIDNRAAWQFLRSLRARAWKLAKLDPEYLYVPSESGDYESGNAQVLPWPYPLRDVGVGITSSQEPGNASDDDISGDESDVAPTIGQQSSTASQPRASTSAISLSTTLQEVSEGLEATTPAPGTIATGTSASQLGDLSWAQWDELFGNVSYLGHGDDIEMGE